MICTYSGCGQIAQETVLSEQRRPGGIVSWIPKHFCPLHAANARKFGGRDSAPGQSDVAPLWPERWTAEALQAVQQSAPAWGTWIERSQPAESL